MTRKRSLVQTQYRPPAVKSPSAIRPRGSSLVAEARVAGAQLRDGRGRPRRLRTRGGCLRRTSRPLPERGCRPRRPMPVGATRLSRRRRPPAAVGMSSLPGRALTGRFAGGGPAGATALTPTLMLAVCRRTGRAGRGRSRGQARHPGEPQRPDDPAHHHGPGQAAREGDLTIPLSVHPRFLPSQSPRFPGCPVRLR